METKNNRRAGSPAAGEPPYDAYNALMTSLQVSVSKHLLDQSYTLVWGNEYFYQITGYSKEEYESKFQNRPDLYYQHHGYAEECNRVMDAAAAAYLQNQPGYSAMIRLPVKGGGHLWTHLSGTFANEPIRGYPVSYTVITNVNDLMQMRLDQSIAYNSIPGFVAKFRIRQDKSVELLDANNAFREFFDLETPELHPSPLFLLNVENNRDRLRAQLGPIKEGKPVRFLCRLLNKEGRTVWMQINGGCVDRSASGPVYLAVCIDVTDLTDLRDMQKKLKLQARQLRDALQATEQANRAKSDFLSRMSHDIRTPMNAITGMTEIAAAHLDRPEKVRDCLRKISISSRHLLGLINDVLDMSKIESGQMTLRTETMSLPALMENIVAILQPMAKAKQQRFSIYLHRLAHEHFLCDSLRLHQCFINILSNASKFTPEGGSITLCVEEALEIRDGTATLTFTFSDTGIGVKPEFLDHIFDAFTRERDGRVDKTEGSGLGMAITKKFVDMMGGSIEVRSTVGQGTTFVLRLPLQVDAEKDGTFSLPPLKILIVDDDKAQCAAAAQALADCGATAEWTDCGAEAVRKILAASDFDTVILGENHLATAEEVRNRLQRNVPVFLAAAYDRTELEPDAQRAGVAAVLAKPLFRSALCRSISDYVLGRQAPVPQRNGEPPARFDGKRILLAEDNELNREIAAELLSDAGAVIETADNGAACVTKFTQSPESYYDMILMDIQMPVMDGYTAAKTIRKLRRSDAAVPILAMTADAFAEDVLAAQAAGMNGHLSKPLDIPTVKRTISSFF